MRWFLRRLLWAATCAALETEGGRELLERVATADPDVGRRLLERLAGRYKARLEMSE